MSVTQETITVENVSIDTYADSSGSSSGTVVVTKNTGLAVGDFMLAGVSVSSGGSPTSMTPPSGWTEVYNTTVGSRVRLGVFYKIAEASDVAASNFTFSFAAGSTGHTSGGFIARISNYGEIVSTTTDTGTTTDLTLNPGTITPDFANSLFVLIGASGNTSGNTQSTSGYAIATDDPTWTEQVDSGANNGTQGGVVALATATRTEISASGSFTIGFGGATNANSAAVALVITPKRTGASTLTAGQVNTVMQPFVPSGVVIVTGETLTNTQVQPTVWTTTIKS